MALTLAQRTFKAHACTAMVETPCAGKVSLFLHLWTQHDYTEYEITHGMYGKVILNVKVPK